MKKTIPMFYVLDLSRKFGSSGSIDPFELFLASVASFLSCADSKVDLHVCTKGWTDFNKGALDRVMLEFPDTAGSLRLFDDRSDEVRGILAKAPPFFIEEEPNGSDTFWSGYQRMKLFPEVFVTDSDLCLYVDNDVFCNRMPLSRFADFAESELSSPDRSGATTMLWGQWDPWDLDEKSKYYGMFDMSVHGFYVNAGTQLCNLGAYRTDEVSASRADSILRAVRLELDDKYDAPRLGDQTILNLMCEAKGFRRGHLPLSMNMCFYKFSFPDLLFREYSKRFPGETTDVGIDTAEKFEKACMTSGTIHLTSYKIEIYEKTYRLKWLLYPYLDLARKATEQQRGFGSVNHCVGAKRLRVDGRVHTPRRTTCGVLPRTRPLFYSSVGDTYFHDYVLPSLASAMARSSCRFDVILATDHSDEGELSSMKRLSSYFGRNDSFRVVDAESAVDLECFAGSQWGGHSTKYVQLASVLVPDVDDYMLFVDGDVLILDDLSRLFDLTDAIPTKDALVARTAAPWGLIWNDEPPPVMIAGGFYLFNPSGALAKSVARSVFSDPWHDNDDCAFPAQCCDDGDVYDISGLLESTYDRDPVIRRAVRARGGIQDPMAAHFVTTRMNMYRFERRAVHPGFGRYQTDFLMFRRLVDTILTGEPK